MRRFEDAGGDDDREGGVGLVSRRESGIRGAEGQADCYAWVWVARRVRALVDCVFQI